MTNYKKLLSEIENSELAMDIMLGNTPRDMYFRAIENDITKELINLINEEPNLIESLIVNFKRFLAEGLEDDIKGLSKFIAYLAVFSTSKSSEAFEIVMSLAEKISKDQFIYEIVDITLERLKENIDTASDNVEDNEFRDEYFWPSNFESMSESQTFDLSKSNEIIGLDYYEENNKHETLVA